MSSMATLLVASSATCTILRTISNLGATCSHTSSERCGWSTLDIQTTISAAKPIEQTGYDAESSRFSHKTASKVPIRRGRGWGNTPQSRSDRAPPVLSPGAAALTRSILTQKSPQDVWDALDALPRCVGSWEDLMETVAEFRRQRKWRSAIVIYEWILQGSMFKPDVGCFNMLMDAYGRTKQWTEAENTFHLMKKFQCLPTETSFNVLMAAYSRGGQLERAERVLHEMKESNCSPGLVTYNTYLEVLNKSGSWQLAEDVFREMQNRGVPPAVNTFTLMINIYGSPFS